MGLSEVVHAFGAQRHAHVGRVVPVVGYIAVRPHGLAVGPNVVVVVAPGAVLADQHAYPLGELAEPGYSCDIGADGHAGSVAGLVSVLVVGALGHAQVGDVLAEESGNRGTGDDADRPFCGSVSEETGEN